MTAPRPFPADPAEVASTAAKFQQWALEVWYDYPGYSADAASYIGVSLGWLTPDDVLKAFETETSTWGGPYNVLREHNTPYQIAQNHCTMGTPLTDPASIVNPYAGYTKDPTVIQQRVDMDTALTAAGTPSDPVVVSGRSAVYQQILDTIPHLPASWQPAWRAVTSQILRAVTRWGWCDQFTFKPQADGTILIYDGSGFNAHPVIDPVAGGVSLSTKDAAGQPIPYTWVEWCAVIAP